MFCMLDFKHKNTDFLANPDSYVCDAFSCWFFFVDILNQEHLGCDMAKPTKWLCAQQRLTSAWASLSTWRKLGSLATHEVHSEDSDQTGRMPRLIWVFAGCTSTLLVLSCRGSFVVFFRKCLTECLRTVVRPSGGTSVSRTVPRLCLCQTRWMTFTNPCRGSVLYELYAARNSYTQPLSSWILCWAESKFGPGTCLEFEPEHDKINKMTCKPSKDSDQPGHLPSMIRVFAVHFLSS